MAKAVRGKLPRTTGQRPVLPREKPAPAVTQISQTITHVASLH
ncbi:MAG TPA: hypothetical protein VE486_05015 [Candidatus Baltobacteraceae bacterium]|nr:hypothetical protein [Candidatus Baltobacteraceae bacterium]